MLVITAIWTGLDGVKPPDNTQEAVDIVYHFRTNVGGKVPAIDQGQFERFNH